jgi:hypothetical protein
MISKTYQIGQILIIPQGHWDDVAWSPCKKTRPRDERAIDRLDHEHAM